MSLSNRPLFLRDVDEDLFLQRVPLTDRLDHAIAASYNVLLKGSRGSGKTTLLRRSLVRLEASNRSAVLVDGRSAVSSGELLHRLIGQMVDKRLLAPFDKQNLADAGPSEILQSIRRRTKRPGVSTVVVFLDGPDHSAAFDIFGRLRDLVWELDLSWVVAADASTAKALSAPPADAFWDVHLSIDTLNVDEQAALLSRRLGKGNWRPDLLDPAGATPRQILSAARDAQMLGNPNNSLEERLDRDLRAAQLGRDESMVLAAMETSDAPLSVGDLANLVGYNRQTLTPALERLVASGLIEKSANGSGTRFRVQRKAPTP